MQIGGLQNHYQGSGLVNTLTAPRAAGASSLNTGNLRMAMSPDKADAADAAFADELIRRAAMTVTQPVAEDGTPVLPKDATGLKNALRDKMAYVRQEFGDDAAAAFKGVVLKELGGKEVTEETLGFGLVKGLAFLDKQFGPGAGDEAIAEFNGSLNQELNAYFDNGFNEKFLVAQREAGDEAGITLQAAPQLFPVQQAEDDDAPSLIELLTRDLLPQELDPTKAQDPATPQALANPYAQLIDGQNPAALSGSTLDLVV